MNKELLSQLINEGLSTYKIAAKLNVSQSTIRHWLKKFGLTTVIIKDNKYCHRCKKDLPKDEFYNRRNGIGNSPYCKSCTKQQTTERQQLFKVKCVEYKDGKCIVCNYDKCISALEFHHLNPLFKDFNISNVKLLSFNDKIKLELDKCILVCSNCHREIHSGLIQV
jgi:DNA-binding transcriptional ArsR family regulator